MYIQWGFEIRISLDFEWWKKGWAANEVMSKFKSCFFTIKLSSPSDIESSLLSDKRGCFQVKDDLK